MIITNMNKTKKTKQICFSLQWHYIDRYIELNNYEDGNKKREAEKKMYAEKGRRKRKEYKTLKPENLKIQNETPGKILRHEEQL